MDEQAIIALSIEGTKFLLRGSKEILAGLVALIRYSSDKLIPARKCRDFLLSTTNVRFLSMDDANIERFKMVAKPYGLSFLHIHDSNGDGLSTVMEGVEAANPTTGRTAENQGVPSKKNLQFSERTQEEWEDVTASIDRSFEEMVEEKRQRKLELYNQDDPLLGKAGAAKTVQTKPSVKQALDRKQEIVKSIKQERVKSALEKQAAVRGTVQRTIQR